MSPDRTSTCNLLSCRKIPKFPAEALLKGKQKLDFIEKKQRGNRDDTYDTIDVGFRLRNLSSHLQAGWPWVREQPFNYIDNSMETNVYSPR